MTKPTDKQMVKRLRQYVQDQDKVIGRLKGELYFAESKQGSYEGLSSAHVLDMRRLKGENETLVNENNSLREQLNRFGDKIPTVKVVDLS